MKWNCLEIYRSAGEQMTVSLVKLWKKGENFCFVDIKAIKWNSLNEFGIFSDCLFEDNWFIALIAYRLGAHKWELSLVHDIISMV